MPTHRWRKLIILRGLPGTGKMDKARAILDDYYGQGEIVSAMDYFRTGRNGEIVFDRNYLGIAHKVAREKAADAMRRGEHPVIICNLNTELWMMYPYVYMGYYLGYLIEFCDMENVPILKDLYRICGEKIPLSLLRRWDRNYEHVHKGLWGVYQILDDPELISQWSRFVFKLKL